MKKIQLNKGLSLNKEAITRLQDVQMSNLRGGVKSISCLQLTCNSSCNNGTCNGSADQQVNFTR
ncbi:rSAM-modified peptide [Flavobacterium sp. TP390]|uniref:RSAM-modified peptide n=1 Tax=Flavobacterium profundi TaxID=1774945 RepID=A0A6I4ILJ5_9FLAO|nr:class I lanthipeptide [Flavobacterium profundi]MVO09569.1 rSAM-modified peptide [Flavobacterium profundi]